MAERAAGTVLAVHGGLVRVQVADRTLVLSARRRLRWEGELPDDPRLVVGDRVDVELDGSQGVVVGVRARRTSLLRRAPSADRAQVLAANVDQALVVFAAHRPDPKQGLLDRFLVACELAGIEPVIVINKVDLGTELVAGWFELYGSLGYTVIGASARTGRSLGRITRRLAGRTTMFCGPSGVGKSSLLNRVHPGFELRVGSISTSTGKGKHVTTRAELLALPGGGLVVDTPGLKEFGLWNLDGARLARAFPEIAAVVDQCRFADCQHDTEPGCAVQAALDDETLDPGRLRTYLALHEELTDEPR
jgi:ribosome biogenesis GTPase